MLTPHDLRPYQWRAIRFMIERKKAALFQDMGLGKTISVLSVIKALKHAGRLPKPVLVVAPIRVMYTVWPQEGMKWSHTRKLRFSIVHGSLKERLAALNVKADIYLINPEGLRWLLDSLSNTRAMNNWPFCMLVIDESSAFKAVGTRRFRKLRHMIHLFYYRFIMTGTPRPNSLLEIWPQIYIVDDGERLGTSSERFKNRFFYTPDDDQYLLVPRAGAEEHINHLIKDVVLSMEASDWKKLPPTVINDVPIILPPQAREIYDRFEEEMFLEMERGDVDAVNAAILGMRCHQIANGAIYTQERETGEKIWEWVHDKKIEALQEIVEETSTPLFVAYHFKHDAFRLREAFPDAQFMAKKGVDRLVDQWNAGDVPLLFAHPANAAHGLNMHLGPGHTLAFFSLTWSYERYIQFINRIGGARAQRKVVVHRIIAQATTDIVMAATLLRKGTGNKDFITALKEYKDERERTTIRSASAHRSKRMDGGARRDFSPTRKRSA